MDEETKQIQQNIILQKYRRTKVWVYGCSWQNFSNTLGFLKIFLIKVGVCVWKERFYKERKQCLNITELVFLRKALFKANISKNYSFPPVTLQLLKMFLDHLVQRRFIRQIPNQFNYFVILPLQPQIKLISLITHNVPLIWLFLKIKYSSKGQEV